MFSTRRSLLKIGLAGLLAPQPTFALATENKGGGFDKWQRKFEAGVPARMAAAKVVGASFAITSKNEAVRYAASFGFADLKKQRKMTPETPIHLASVSKLFMAVALVQLFERRGYDLHSDINTFLDFPVKNPSHPRVAITPHQLVTHTSSISDEGYGDYSVEGDPTQSLASFLKDYLVEGGSAYSPKTSFLTSKPGAKWDYSNVGAALAGYLVEVISKKSFSTYVEENLLAPLGITNAHWYLREFAPDVLAKPYRFENGEFVELPQEGYPDVPAGMLRCSVSDLAKALHAMLGQQQGKNAILSQTAVREMLRRQVAQSIFPFQGLGWIEEETAKRKVIGHTGSDNGASNMVALTKDNSQAVVVLMNIDGTDDTSSFRASIIEDLLAGAKLVN
ncbi:serine hydrolase domain-containing protein [Sinorhizobium sp. RAC02]|uniref:serine hydrolase domain-containing protein n=1 Tax=Sinorhizobium sp. RAC02 TaxID=1842534 RepID=UPI00083E1F20|nr:serine hydrolase domain-containing protein [Sinorhizobium sp. RAC02]AOF92431.1 beta-lactamase family protein [Sinorhizobium sp. RAC02]